MTKENKFCVYMHVNKINNKKYIGITGYNANQRWGKNGYGYHTQIFGRAIAKYGWNNFKHEILYDDLSFKVACDIEKKLISYYKTNNSDYGYNIASGGMENPILSEQAKLKISGSNNYGSRRIICVNTGEVFDTIRDAENTYKNYNVNNQNISKCCKGKRNYCGILDNGEQLQWSYYEEGKSYKLKEYKRDTNAKSVNQYDINNNYIATYESAREAEKHTGIGYKLISRVCNGKRKQTKGYIFRFADC